MFLIAIPASSAFTLFFMSEQVRSLPPPSRRMISVWLKAMSLVTLFLAPDMVRMRVVLWVTKGFLQTRMLPSRLIAYMRSLKTLTATRNNQIFLGFFMSQEEPVSIEYNSSILIFQTLISLSDEHVTKCSSLIQSKPKIPPLCAFYFSAIRQYLRPSCNVSFLSAPPVRIYVPLGLYFTWLMKPLCVWSDCLKEYGGPSKNLRAIQSPPKTSLQGLSGRKEQEFNVLVTPVISPALVPVQTKPTLPKEFLPSPTAQIRLPSALQSILFALGKKFSNCLTNKTLSGHISLMIRTPFTSREATRRPSGLNLAAATSLRWTTFSTGLVGS